MANPFPLPNLYLIGDIRDMTSRVSPACIDAHEELLAVEWASEWPCRGDQRPVAGERRSAESADGDEPYDLNTLRGKEPLSRTGAVLEGADRAPVQRCPGLERRRPSRQVLEKRPSTEIRCSACGCSRSICAMVRGRPSFVSVAMKMSSCRQGPTGWRIQRTGLVYGHTVSIYGLRALIHGLKASISGGIVEHHLCPSAFGGMRAAPPQLAALNGAAGAPSDPAGLSYPVLSGLGRVESDFLRHMGWAKGGCGMESLAFPSLFTAF